MGSSLDGSKELIVAKAGGVDHDGGNDIGAVVRTDGCDIGEKVEEEFESDKPGRTILGFCVDCICCC